MGPSGLYAFPVPAVLENLWTDRTERGGAIIRWRSTMCTQILSAGVTHKYQRFLPIQGTLILLKGLLYYVFARSSLPT